MNHQTHFQFKQVRFQQIQTKQRSLYSSRSRERQQGAPGGSILVISLVVLFVTLATGLVLAQVVYRDFQRSVDSLHREQAMQAADAGIEAYLDYLTNQISHGDLDSAGSVKAASLPQLPLGGTPGLNSGATYIVTAVPKGTRQVLINSTGTKESETFTVSVVVRYWPQNVNAYANALYTGYTEADVSIANNANFHGPVHLQSTNEPFIDLNGNGVYNSGDPYIDIFNNGSWADAFGSSQPNFDLSADGFYNNYVSGSDFTGAAGTALKSYLDNKLPALPQSFVGGKWVNTLHSTLRVENGEVGLSGAATAGQAQSSTPAGQAGQLDGVYVNDGYTLGSVSRIHSLNGTSKPYDLTPNLVSFPNIFNPVDASGNLLPINPIQGLADASKNLWVDSISNPLNPTVYQYHQNKLILDHTTAGSDRAHAFTVGNPNTNGLLFYKDPNGKPNSYILEIKGTVHVAGTTTASLISNLYNGAITIGDPGGTVTYSGSGTLVTGSVYQAVSSTRYRMYPRGHIYVHGNLIAQGNYPSGGFPTNVIGLVGHDEVELDTNNTDLDSGPHVTDTQSTVMGVFYAQDGLFVGHGSNVIGSSVCAKAEILDNDPSFYYVPDIENHLPPNMPGSAAIWWRITTEVNSYQTH